jgi:hypothetical protein
MDPTSNISRWVAFLLAPLAALAAGLLAHAALSIFGITLDPTATTAWMLGVMGGLIALAYKWLHNRGQAEIAHALGTSPQQLDELASLVASRLPAPPKQPPPA